ncbi:hypothetical protein K2173_013794 [Erythroxylum novogranatense]|uniref:Uncharacterized protein n=1 Tax=Erythroxylum novogranatense TaxID=1862640 RepID=A0AAV8SCV6_9ROSI|nr:hypothetical protein K2173_013794 [Erythroxylum novogranatense]
MSISRSSRLQAKRKSTQIIFRAKYPSKNLEEHLYLCEPIGYLSWALIADRELN